VALDASLLHRGFMPRINIEDSIYKDPRFTQLVLKVQNLDQALGMLVRAWTVAQKWFLTETKRIPENEWEKNFLSHHLIEVGLVKKDDSGYWVCGANEQFSWLTQRVEAGKLGGLARAKRPLARAKRPLAGHKQNVASSSSSVSENINTHMCSDEHPADLELIYQKYPRRDGATSKDLGMDRIRKIIAASPTALADVTLAVENYKAECDRLKRTGTELVKHFGNFFGPKGPWKEYITINQPTKLSRDEYLEKINKE
jgi:hypothetical protein